MHLHYPRIHIYFFPIVLVEGIATIAQYIASTSTLFFRRLATFTFESATSVDLQLRFGRKRFSLTGDLHISLGRGGTTSELEERLLMSEEGPSQERIQTTTSTTQEERPHSPAGSDHWKTAFESPQDSPHKEDQAAGGPDPTQDFADQVLARLEEIRLRRLRRQRRTSTEPIPSDTIPETPEQPQPPSEQSTQTPSPDEEHAIWQRALGDIDVIDSYDSYSDDSLPDGVRTHIRDDHSFGSR